MAVINTWSHCAYAQADLVTVFLKSSHRAAFAMLSALTSSEARRAAIQALAKSSLSADDYELYEQVDKAISPSRATRNRFAHGLWCSMPSLKDSILVIDADNLARGDLAMVEAGGSMPMDDYLRSLDYDQIWVYKFKELKKHRNDAYEALVLLRQFASLVHQQPPEREKRRIELLTMLKSSSSPESKSPKRTPVTRRR